MASVQTGKSIDIFSPIDGEKVRSIPAMTQEEVDEVMEVARRAQKKWRETPLIERAKVLNEAAFLIRKHKEEIAKVLVKEIAKDIKSSLAEVERTADFLLFTADAAKQMKGEMLQADVLVGYIKERVEKLVVRDPYDPKTVIVP
ncbi:MAG: aldehyde dehydrogenase family protein [Niameybacter sp.]